MAIHIQKVLPAIAALGMVIQSEAPAFSQSYSSGCVPPAYNNKYNAANTPAYQQGRVSYAPAGLTIPVRLSTAISTDVAKPGDRISATLTDNVNLGNSIIPAGSMVTGRVTGASSGGFLGRAGMLTVQFNSLRTPSGHEVPMAAHVIGGIGKYTEVAAQSGTYAGETWRTKAGQTAIRGAIGAGTGAALGTAIGAIAGAGSHRTGRAVGRGAWSGAAIGGGLGVANALLLRKGKNVVISSGTPMQIQLDAPMTISQSTQSGAF